MDKNTVAEWFSYRKPTDEDVAKMAKWREGLTNVAADFAAETPMSGDVIMALRHLKLAMMAMNSALVSPMPEDPSAPR